MAVGFASGLVCLAFTALLPDTVAYVFLGAQLTGAPTPIPLPVAVGGGDGCRDDCCKP